MKKQILRIIIVLGVVISCPNSWGQSQSSLLTDKDQKKIEKAEKRLVKAEKIVDKKIKYTSQIEELESKGSRRVKKIERLTTKANRVIIKSSSYFKVGYKGKFKAYKKVVKRELKEGNLGQQAIGYKEQGDKAYKVGKKWRRMSANQEDVNKGVEYLFKANNVHKDAIKSLISALDTYTPQEEVAEQAEVVKESAIKEDTISISPVQEQVSEAAPDTMQVEQKYIVTAPDTLAAKQDDSAIITPIISEVSGSEDPVAEVPKAAMEEMLIYFTVQFLSVQQPVTKEKLNSLYKGSFEILKHKVNGAFKYSFGKFKTYEEAKSELVKSGVPGYVVAYHNEKRISARQAIELLSGK
jgi:hypothetical protein